jgi:RHS repeat-associated protein
MAISALVSGGAAKAQSGQATGALGFTGEWRSADGTPYLRGRVYHPRLRRFIQRDIVAGSIATPMSGNRYAYVEGNPATWTDPSGLSAAKGSGRDASSSYVTGFEAVTSRTLIGLVHPIVPPKVTAPTGLTPIYPPAPGFWPKDNLNLPESLPEGRLDKMLNPDGGQEEPCAADEEALWRFTNDDAGTLVPLVRNYADGAARRKIMQGAAREPAFRDIAGWCHTRGMSKGDCLNEFLQPSRPKYDALCARFGAAACGYSGSPFISATEDPANFMALEYRHKRSRISMDSPYLLKMCVPRSRIRTAGDLYGRFRSEWGKPSRPIAVPEREVIVRCPAGNCAPYVRYRARNPFYSPRV